MTPTGSLLLAPSTPLTYGVPRNMFAFGIIAIGPVKIIRLVELVIKAAFGKKVSTVELSKGRQNWGETVILP
jgi:hypothetical protein